MNVTPELIEELKLNEVFVFGSNLAGRHNGGAARTARKKFGAIQGQGVGLQGQSYAIPTMHGGVEDIQPYVDEFISFAKNNNNLHFYVTKIGCGIAGFKIDEIAPLFSKCIDMNNVSLPIEFINYIKS
ncbi:A1S_2505 family phage non-structural protein [Phocaeicola plebeius]|uniref:A1S_2505 family phage non-structural protein n=1 Tax=Phocaeicola plebeius TaxID=310297 RepID=UPI003566E68A